MGTLPRLVLRRRFVLAAYLTLVAAVAPGLARLETDNSHEAFFVRDTAALGHYRKMQRAFGSFEALRIVAAGPGL